MRKPDLHIKLLDDFRFDYCKHFEAIYLFGNISIWLAAGALSLSLHPIYSVDDRLVAARRQE